MTTSFITGDELAAYIGSDWPLDSTLANLAVDGACEAVRGYVDQNVESTTETNAYLDGNGLDNMVLPHFPLISISALSVYVDRTDTAPEVLVENTDYVVNYGRGIVSRIDGGVFTKGRQNIKLTYVYGNATVPADVRVVALQVASRIYEVGMVKSDSAGGVSATYVEGAGSLTGNEKDLLRRYRA